MRGVRSKSRIAVVVLLAVCVGLSALYGLLRPISNGCVMTYMYPMYIPISSPKGTSTVKYGLYLYHEGWKKIDFEDHLKQLSGVPVLFIPGNGGSFKQVRSIAAESDRAYQGGPIEHSFYQEASLTPEEGGLDEDLVGFELPSQYSSKLDWFAVDLEGEHSAMDGGILEEHTEYVVYAIHRILDQYKESYDAREKEGVAASGSLPKSVILVGHSMGGFVARAAIIHPRLRRSAVETVLTLSSPHQSPPLALQPSLGYYFAHVNNEWRKGYEVQTTRSGLSSNPRLSHVAVVSITGGYNDYQVRSKLESLDGIVPRTHGLMISSTGMKNVWLSMEHQAILWCNQLVVQVSHTLLSLIDSRTNQPFADTRRRVSIFSRMLRSPIPHSFNWGRSHLSPSLKDAIDSNGSVALASNACPNTAHWGDNGLEKDLYIQMTTVPILAMDGRRRWLDIQKLGSNGKNHFIFVTNLAPCTGVRLHLWPEKRNSASEFPGRRRVLEVTSRMVNVPSGPAPKQIEPGSQTEQPPPSGIVMLRPEDMRGFRFLTISVAPRPTISGRPPPAASMAVGQFFNPEEAGRDISPWLMLQSTYSQKEMLLKEGHPLALNLSFSISLGLLPVTLSLKTDGCGIENSGLQDEDDRDAEKLCKLRCFPPIAFAWDDTSGLHVYPNLLRETIVVDSSPSLWSSAPNSEKTNVLLLVDPHCSYKTSIDVSFTRVASRFLLVYNPQIVGFSVVVIFFALMRQARTWDLDLPIPSMLTAVESNLRVPLPFFYLGIAPILLSLLLSYLMTQPLPLVVGFTFVSVVCYLLANGLVIVLVLISQLVFYAAAYVHIFIKTRWESTEGNVCFGFLHWFFSFTSGLSTLKVVRVLRVNPPVVTALSATTLACLVHPALGLFVLIFSHALCCHNALCSHARENDLFDFNKEADSGDGSEKLNYDLDGKVDQRFFVKESPSNSPNSSKSFGETQLELFHHRQGLLVLHFVAALMFVPSFAAWLQRIGMGESLPWLLDSVVCTGVILHGICNSKPDYNALVLSFPGVGRWEVRLHYVYLIAGYCSYLSGLALAPYRVFYAMAAIGFMSFALRLLQRNTDTLGSRKHSHRH